MKSFPSLWVQHLLFFVPYFFTALTCVTLWVVDVEEDEHCTVTLRVAAAFNTTLLTFYLMGWLNPHYLKLGCGAFNTVAVAYLVLQRHFAAAVICMAVYNVPAFLFVLQAVWVPSISEISPGLYVGNRGAAKSRQILRRCGITHVLDMSGSASSSTDSSVQEDETTLLVKKSVYVNDFFWGSQHSLDTVLEECLAFLQKSHQTTTATTTIAKKPTVTLIHCSAGQSRSAAMAAYYLMVTQQRQGNDNDMMCYRDVYRWIRRHRPVVDIHSDHLAPLRALHEAQYNRPKRT